MARKDDDGGRADFKTPTPDDPNPPPPPIPKPPGGGTPKPPSSPRPPDPPRPGEANLPVTQLKPSERRVVTFTPPEGTIKVTASAIQVGLGKPTGKPSA